MTFDLPGYDNPEVVKGRIVTLEFANSWVVGTYVPNAGEKLKVLEINVSRSYTETEGVSIEYEHQGSVEHRV